jgi:hypothetical protein
MSDIVLVKQAPVEIPEPERAAARKVLFGVVDGLGAANKKSWRRFFGMLMRLEPGEIVEIMTRKQRSGPFHRRHMALEQRVFEAQERIDRFEEFRMWLKLGAGFVTWRPGPRGGVFPIPRSIAYSELEEGDMRQFHDDAVAFLRTEHAGKYLWPHLPAGARIDAIEAVLRGFGE